jgi:hypothetical protein
MAAALGVALGAGLALPAGRGHAELGSAIALGFVLTAVPTLPVSVRAMTATVSARALCVLGGAAAVVLTGGHPAALAVATVAAAVIGAYLGLVGPTAALAVVLIAVDTGAFHGAPAGWADVPVYGLGAVAVPVSWGAWAALRAAARRPALTAQEHAPVTAGRQVHAVRVGAAVAIASTGAFALAAALPTGAVGAHWLVTCVVLTIQPGAAQTGVRLAQRLSGNTVGAVIAAALLGTHLPVPAVLAATVVLFTTAMALRPVNYTWWAVTGPPLLLVISEYPQAFPWYEGGVRLVMNLLGAAVVVAVVFAVPAVWNRVRSSAVP